MKYKSLTEYFKDNQQSEFHDCLDYYGKFENEILDSDFGKSDDKLYKKVKML